MQFIYLNSRIYKQIYQGLWLEFKLNLQKIILFLAYYQRLMSNDPSSDERNSHCSIVGLVGILVQIGLGVLSFSVLIIKRHFENPKRPWKIWTFDTLKQVISQMLAHFINLTISLALNEQDPNSDTCLWYFITNVLDNTFGVFICVITLRLLQKVFYRKRKYFLISGHYYEITQTRKEEMDQNNRDVQEKIELSTQKIIINYKAWLFQLIIWNSIVIVTKLILFTVQYLLRDVLDLVSNFLLGWIQAYPNLQLVVVIVIIPVIMNGFAFWVQDNFLKKRDIPGQIQAQSIQVQLNNQLQQHHQEIELQENQNEGEKKEEDISNEQTSNSNKQALKKQEQIEGL